MKELLIRIVLFVLPFIILYLLTAFVVNDLNSSNWEVIDRRIVASLGSLLGGFLIYIPIDIID
jgi:hypothetical protein